MDFELDLSTLDSKSSDLESQSSKVKSICEEYNSSYLTKLSGSEISSLSTTLKKNMDRLEKGYANSSDWFKRHNSEFTALEESLSSFKAANMTSPIEFKDTFVDLFTKVTVPMWTTAKQNERKKTQEETAADGSIAAKRAAFIGNLDNDTNKYYIDPRYPNMQKDLRVFNNQTGEEIFDGNTIHLKKGETIVLTVALPYNAGVPEKIIRTTAADVSGPGDKHKITSSKSNISGDPNNIQYVNYQYNHWPDGVNLHTNYYEWIITADKVGSREISQTCEYKSSAGTPKSMIGINVVVTDS